MRNTTPKLLSLLLSLTIAASLAACGSAGNESSPTAEPPAEARSSEVLAEPSSQTASTAETGSITVTDQAGREVVIEGAVEKIVSGYYISSSACIALGLADKLVGIEAKAESRPIYSMAAPQLLELPNVGTAKEFNMEGCVALEPDLVILPKRLKDSADTMTELGIPVILVSPESHQELVDMITLIGQATGAEDSASKLIAYYNDELAAVEEFAAQQDPLPITYMAGNSSYLSTAPKDMYQASLITAAGGVNAAAEIDGDNWTDVSYEQLIAMDPDVIVIPAEAGYTKEDIMADPQLAALSAVREAQVYQMPKDFEPWDSPVPSCTLGLRWMLYALHEPQAPLEQLQTTAAAFYKEFYGVEIDASQIGK